LDPTFWGGTDGPARLVLEGALGLEPDLISCEITETSAATIMQAATAFATRLKRLGWELALDDRATGLGSFTFSGAYPSK
jgi:EAL domain-containing protein (putative c-di-GMP-specific phosphodiesterase class I)